MKPLRKKFLGGLLFLHGTFFHWQRKCQKLLFLLDFFVHYVMMILRMLVDQSHSIMMCYLVTSDPLIQH
ncbi:MAG: hypothetical protein EGR29_01585 [Faecalibacterium prausnitzii]|nr:hypothetical protein [Faecalibacterium prausnitzii]